MKMKEMKGFCFAFLALVVLLLNSCAAAPGILMYGNAALGSIGYASTMGIGSFGLGGGNNGTSQDGVVVFRDGEFAKAIAKKAFANLGIPVDASIPGENTVAGTTNDGVRVKVEIVEKTQKLTEMKISAKKNFVVSDPMVVKSVGDEIKRLAGIKS